MKPLIFHYPQCGTSCNTLALIEASGESERVESAEAVSRRVNQSTH